MILVFIVRLVRRGHLRAKYSMLWLFVGVGVAAFAIFPDILTWASDRLGIAYPPATFLLFAVAFLVMLALHFSWELSRLEDRTRSLTEEVALLTERVDACDRRARAPGDGDGDGDGGAMSGLTARDAEIDQWDMVHRLPPARIVDRIGLLRDQARGRRVVHLGFADARCATFQADHDAWLHAQLAEVASELVGLDVDDAGVAAARDAGYESYCVDCRDRAAVAALAISAGRRGRHRRADRAPRRRGLDARSRQASWSRRVG